jgi:ATP synthase protein I
MATDETGQDPKLPSDARLDSLEQRLERAQQREAIRSGKAPAADANEQMGQKVLSLLIGGLAGGALIGWLIDSWRGEGHLFLIVGVVLGIVGGFWSIFKIANGRP